MMHVEVDPSEKYKISQYFLNAIAGLIVFVAWGHPVMVQIKFF